MISTDNSPASSKQLAKIGERLPVEDVIGWLLDGHRDADIRAAIAELFPGVDPMELQNQAVEHFARAAEFEMAVVQGWALEAYRELYKRMVSIGDFAGAMRAVKELVALANNVRNERQENDDEEEQEQPAGDPAAPELLAPDQPTAKRRGAKKRTAQG